MTVKLKVSSADLERFYRSIVEDNEGDVCDYFERYDFDRFDELFQKRHNSSIVQKVCQNDAQNVLNKILTLNQSNLKVCFTSKFLRILIFFLFPSNSV